MHGKESKTLTCFWRAIMTFFKSNDINPQISTSLVECRLSGSNHDVIAVFVHAELNAVLFHDVNQLSDDVRNLVHVMMIHGVFEVFLSLAFEDGSTYYRHENHNLRCFYNTFQSFFFKLSILRSSNEKFSDSKL